MQLIFPGLKVGIIMPAFNEQMNIGNTLSLIPKNISEWIISELLCSKSLKQLFAKVKILESFNQLSPPTVTFSILIYGPPSQTLTR